MDKKSRVTQILFQIKEQTDELLDNETTEDMTAEEIVVLSTEIVTSSRVATIDYTSPVGQVDRTKVTFMLDDEFQFPLFGEEYYEED